LTIIGRVVIRGVYLYTPYIQMMCQPIMGNGAYNEYHKLLIENGWQLACNKLDCLEYNSSDYKSKYKIISNSYGLIDMIELMIQHSYSSLPVAMTRTSHYSICDYAVYNFMCHLQIIQFDAFIHAI
jgi:hypothetical protein